MHLPDGGATAPRLDRAAAAIVARGHTCGQMGVGEGEGRGGQTYADDGAATAELSEMARVSLN